MGWGAGSNPSGECGALGVREVGASLGASNPEGSRWGFQLWPLLPHLSLRGLPPYPFMLGQGNGISRAVSLKASAELGCE